MDELSKNIKQRVMYMYLPLVIRIATHTKSRDDKDKLYIFANY